MVYSYMAYIRYIRALKKGYIKHLREGGQRPAQRPELNLHIRYAPPLIYAMLNLGYFRCEAPIYRPMEESPLECFSVYVKLLSPLTKVHCNAIVRNREISRSIINLYIQSNPPTISWRIPSIIILPINTMLIRRPITHILIEILKGVFPPITYSNTTLSVMWISFIITTRFYPLPDLIHRM